MSTFLADMAMDSRGQGVVVMAYSEFGRRVRVNVSHGTAGPVLLAGCRSAAASTASSPA